MSVYIHQFYISYVLIHIIHMLTILLMDTDGVFNHIFFKYQCHTILMRKKQIIHRRTKWSPWSSATKPWLGEPSVRVFKKPGEATLKTGDIWDI